MRLFLLYFATLLTAFGNARMDLKSATLADAPAAHRKAIEFLIDHMPAADVAILKPDVLRQNVDLAYQARSRFPWSGEIPEELFFNDVLPYAVLDEARDDWRAGFFERFSKVVAGTKTAREAVIKINASITAETGVSYDTRRRAPNQGPVESMKLGMASCTGLSILLVDALRAVGLPARVTGVALWTTKMGNHNWVEVWLPDTKQWQFTEYGGGSNDFDRGWLLTEAARAIPGSIVHGVYATSWKPTGSHFPTIWALRNTSIPGVEVTKRYLEMGKATLPAVGECELRIEVMASGQSGSAARRAMEVKVLQGDVVVTSGNSPTQTDDMNRFLTVKVSQGQIYQVVAFQNGRPAAISRIEIGGRDEIKKVTLSLPS